MVTLVDLPPELVTSVAVVLGLVIGSFLNVVIYRLPRGKSLVWPGSTCPGCGHLIAAYDNIPVLSWLLLFGRSRCCKTRISPRYPLIEAIGGLYAWALVVLVIGTLPADTVWWRLILLFGLHLWLMRRLLQDLLLSAFNVANVRRADSLFSPVLLTTPVDGKEQIEHLAQQVNGNSPPKR